MWLRVDKAAEILKVSRRAVYTRIDSGMLLTKKTCNNSSLVWIEDAEHILSIGQRFNHKQTTKQQTNKEKTNV